jgi:glucose 1-dehydrogenase
MRAVAVVPGDKRIELIDDHPTPVIEADDEVVLDVLDVGVCGTDREIVRFEYGTPPPDARYLVIGHESLARVARTGSAVERVRPGDLVVVMVRRPCPHASCAACRAHRQDFCFTGDFTERGIKGAHGFMTEQVVDAERYLHAVPAALRDVAVLIEPLTIAEKALIQVWDIQERLPWTPAGAGDGHGRRAVVLGAGPVGLLGALACIVRGFETWVYSREVPTGAAGTWVGEVGAHYVCSEQTSLAELRTQVGTIDLVYEATGASKLAFETLAVLGTNGVFCFTGVPGRKAKIELDSATLMRDLVLKNQLVFGTVNAGAGAFAAAITDLALFHARWPTQLPQLITKRVTPDEAVGVLKKDPGGLKTVVAFGARGPAGARG